MSDEDIVVINDWFKKHDERVYETYHHTKEEDGEDVYVVAYYDMESFTDMLRDNFPDLIGFPCIVGTYGIWFSSDDLAKAGWL